MWLVPSRLRSSPEDAQRSLSMRRVSSSDVREEADVEDPGPWPGIFGAGRLGFAGGPNASESDALGAFARLRFRSGPCSDPRLASPRRPSWAVRKPDPPPPETLDSLEALARKTRRPARCSAWGLPRTHGQCTNPSSGASPHLPAVWRPHARLQVSTKTLACRLMSTLRFSYRFEQLAVVQLIFHVSRSNQIQRHELYFVGSGGRHPPAKGAGPSPTSTPTGPPPVPRGWPRDPPRSATPFPEASECLFALRPATGSVSGSPRGRCSRDRSTVARLGVHAGQAEV